MTGDALPGGRCGVPSEAALEYCGGSWAALEDGRLGGGAALKKPRLVLPGVDEPLPVGVAAYCGRLGEEELPPRGGG